MFPFGAEINNLSQNLNIVFRGDGRERNKVNDITDLDRILNSVHSTGFDWHKTCLPMTSTDSGDSVKENIHPVLPNSTPSREDIR